MTKFSFEYQYLLQPPRSALTVAPGAGISDNVTSSDKKCLLAVKQSIISHLADAIHLVNKAELCIFMT